MPHIDSPFPKLKLTVTAVFGNCYHGYNQGDVIVLDDFTHPPQHFCLGLAHALFPTIYALTFQARFGFRENQRSLSVTCPDGGKLQFEAEVLDADGSVQVVPKSPSYGGTSPKKLRLEVVQSNGKCFHGYKVGDRWETVGLKCIDGLCGAAFHTAFPALFALNFGAEFFFVKPPNSIDTVTCPDGGNVVFRASRVEEVGS